DIPRKLEYMEFICHAPSNYFRNPYSPYPTTIEEPKAGFIWTRKDSGMVQNIADCKKICSKARIEEIPLNGRGDDHAEDHGNNQKDTITPTHLENKRPLRSKRKSMRINA